MTSLDTCLAQVEHRHSTDLFIVDGAAFAKAVGGPVEPLASVTAEDVSAAYAELRVELKADSEAVLDGLVTAPCGTAYRASADRERCRAVLRRVPSLTPNP